MTITNRGNSNEVICSNGTRHVVITFGKAVYTRHNKTVYESVTARKFTGHTDLIHADCSPLSWKGKTLDAAYKWAEKQIG